VAVLIAVMTYLTYRWILDAVGERGRLHLEQYVAERAKREEARFIQIQQNLQLAARTFLQRYHQADDGDFRDRWDRLVQRSPDGGWRSPRHTVDGARDITIWAHKDVVLTPELLRRTIVLHDMAESFRPVWIDSFRSFWCATPEMTNIGFDPLIPNWIYNTPADWPQNKIDYVANAGPERNPDGKITWTRSNYQEVENEYFVSVCLPVYDRERFVAIVGHDIRALSLIEESVKADIAGMTHMLFMEDGSVVAHPTKRKEILASLGRYSMKDDPTLRPLYAAIVESPHAMLAGFDEETAQYFAATRVAGPGWYFIATLPRALLAEQASEYLPWVLIASVASLTLLLGCLTLIIRRTVTLPLRRLIVATERLGAGDPNYRLAFDRDDEIGRLSKSLNDMATNVADRNDELRQLNQNLENRISERTVDLAASESRVRTLLENTPEAIVVLDVTTGKYVDGNTNALRFLGVDREGLLRRSPMDARAHHQPDGRTSAAAARARIEAAMAGETQVFEWLFRPSSGPDVPCEIRLSRLPSTTAQLAIGTITDISERKKAEQSLLQALAHERELGEMKSGFVSTVSHEFRTPLGVILSSTEILLSYFDRLNAERRNEHLRTIVRSVRSLSRLVEEVLLLGKVEAGRLKFSPAAIALPTLCDQLVDEARSAAELPHEISLMLGVDLMDAVGDEDLLRHIVANVLSNAVKYSPAGSLVTLSVQRDREHAVFTITDRGIGIPADDQRNLYQAFQRGRNVGSRPGTGLGLAIVHSFVKHHGGEIDVVSEVDVGTTVTIRLPLFGRFIPAVSRSSFLDNPPASKPIV
jgi:PAS domain S-box-containing protein